MTNSDRTQSKLKRKEIREPRDPAVTVALITRRGTILAALIAVVGAVFVALININVQPARNASDRGSLIAPSLQGTTSKRGNTPADAVPEQVKLDGGMGVDLDESHPSPVLTSGPDGDIDLYFGGGALAANRSGLFYYYGTDSEASTQCSEIVSEGQQSVPGPTVTFAGTHFCLRTSNGTIGWISINDVKVSGDAGYIVINYKLFH